MAYLLTAVVIIVLDQSVKFLVRANLAPGEFIDIIGSFFRITCSYNKGAALGLFSGKSVMLTVIPLVLIIVILLFVFLNRYTHPLVKYALTMIAAGGAGNMVDRIVYGQVTDMFSFSIFPPVFNVADIAVTSGAVILVVYILFGEKINNSKKQHRKKTGGS